MLNYRSLNQVNLVGRIGQCKVVEGKAKFLSLSVATESLRKNAEGKYETATEWHNVSYFGSNVEKMATALTKGTYIVVVGSLSSRKTEKGTFTNVIADSIQILSTGGGAKEKAAAPAAKPAPAGGTAEDDCPF